MAIISLLIESFFSECSRFSAKGDSRFLDVISSLSIHAKETLIDLIFLCKNSVIDSDFFYHYKVFSNRSSFNAVILSTPPFQIFPLVLEKFDVGVSLRIVGYNFMVHSLMMSQSFTCLSYAHLRLSPELHNWLSHSPTF